VRDSLIPYMNGRIEDGDAAFVVHTGDFIRGGGPASNTRCTGHSFSSRKRLFARSANFLVVPGDNDWNECYGYDISSNTDPTREMWRSHFAAETSPFHQFGRDFPGGAAGRRPTIRRQASNPENYFFVAERVAFFGINRPDRESHVSDRADVDPNESWVEERLALASCDALDSIVIISHSPPKESLYGRAEERFARCGGAVLPVLTVSGNAQPRTYCMTRDAAGRERVAVTVEALQSGPLLISVVRDPDGGGDFFHVEDVDPVDSNRRCPALS